MRQIGVIPSEQEAKRFAAYLMTLGVAAHAEPEAAATEASGGANGAPTGTASGASTGAAIWVRDENHLTQAREELSRFRQNPADSRYQGAEREAAGIQREQERKRDQARKNIVEMRGRWGRPQPRRQPLTMVVLGLCILLGFLTGFDSSKEGVVTSALKFQDQVAARKAEAANPNLDRDALAYRLSDIRRGEVWRLVTPIFLHGDHWHLVFNMIMLYQLGAILEPKLGTPKFALLMLLTGVASIASQALVPSEWQGSTNVVGISGVLFGFVGYMWMKTVVDPGMGIRLAASTVVFLGVYMFLGFYGILESAFGIPVANWAHGVGLVAGMALAFIPPLGKWGGAISSS